MTEKQAWIRFLLGLILIGSIVWGASAKLERIAATAAGNKIKINLLFEDSKSVWSKIHDLDLQNQETSINQRNIMSSLIRIEKKISN